MNAETETHIDANNAVTHTEPEGGQKQPGASTPGSEPVAKPRFVLLSADDDTQGVCKLDGECS